jgi:large subunit ribosomal protein L7e
MSSKGFVPQSYANKNERDTAEVQALSKRRQERKVNIKSKREEWKAKAEKYHTAYQTAQQNLINEKRKARNDGNFYVAPEAKVAFAIRIKG